MIKIQIGTEGSNRIESRKKAQGIDGIDDNFGREPREI
jgi:hypothetical protein